MTQNLRGREAIRWLNEPEVPTHNQLRDMLVSCLLVNETADKHVDHDMFAHLLRAYTAALTDWADDNGKQLKFTSEQAAFDLLRAKYIEGYRAHFPDADGESIAADLSWPELLPYKSEYTISFITEVGYALGYYWGRWSQAMQEYILKQEARKEATT